MNPPALLYPVVNPLNDATIIKLKLLLSQQSSGIIIGRRGAFVTKLAEQSLARVRISNHAEFFPGNDLPHSYRSQECPRDCQPVRWPEPELTRQVTLMQAHRSASWLWQAP